MRYVSCSSLFCLACTSVRVQEPWNSSEDLQWLPNLSHHLFRFRFCKTVLISWYLWHAERWTNNGKQCVSSSYMSLTWCIPTFWSSLGGGERRVEDTLLKGCAEGEANWIRIDANYALETFARWSLNVVVRQLAGLLGQSFFMPFALTMFSCLARFRVLLIQVYVPPFSSFWLSPSFRMVQSNCPLFNSKLAFQ